MYIGDGWAEGLCNVETAGPRNVVYYRRLGQEMGYMGDGWAEGVCTLEMSGPRDSVMWRRLGRGMCYRRNGWAAGVFTLEMNGPRDCVTWRRLGRGTCHIRHGWAETLVAIETGGPSTVVPDGDRWAEAYTIEGSAAIYHLLVGRISASVESCRAIFDMVDGMRRIVHPVESCRAILDMVHGMRPIYIYIITYKLNLFNPPTIQPTHEILELLLDAMPPSLSALMSSNSGMAYAFVG